jgi:hypothetical protein
MTLDVLHMTRLTIRFTSKNGCLGGVLVVAVVVSIMIGISALPGMIFSTVLTPAEAESTIRGHLLSENALHFGKQIADADPEHRVLLESRYFEEKASIKALEFVSVDVDTVIFSFFRINRSFVAKAVIRGNDQKLSTRYYCFIGKYLTRECSAWNWLIAW